MDILDKGELRELLSRYLKDEISTEESSRLKNVLNTFDDEELSSVLGQCWDQYDTSQSIDKELRNEMLLSINDALNISNKKKRRNLSFYLLRIAAAILFVGLCTQLTVTYSKINNLELLMENTLTIQTETGERSKLFLPDGTEVYLNSETTLSYPQRFGKDSRNLKMTGEAFFKVAKVEGKKFTVDLDAITVEVLGTHFNISSYASDDVMEMALVSGKIKVSTNVPVPQVIYLNPNEKAIFDKKTGSIKVQSSNNRTETAWIDNKLVFISTPLKDVIARLEKWYGVTIHTDITNDLAEDKFTGSFKDTEISDIIKILRNYYKFEYRIKGYDIYITTN